MSDLIPTTGQAPVSERSPSELTSLDVALERRASSTSPTSGTNTGPTKEEVATVFEKLGIGFSVAADAGILVYAISVDAREYELDDDGMNRPVFKIPFDVVPTNLARQWAETPGELVGMSVSESLLYGHADLSLIMRTLNPPAIYAMEMGELTTDLAGKYTGPLGYASIVRGVSTNPVLTYDGSDPGVLIIRFTDGALAFAGLSALPASMQVTSNNMNNVIPCEEGVDPEVCEELQERAEDTEGDSDCEDLGICDEEEGEAEKDLAERLTPGTSELSRAITAFELEGQAWSFAAMINGNLVGVQAFEIDGKPWLGLAVGALMIPAQFGMAAAANVNPNPRGEGSPLTGENIAMSVGGFGLGALEAISTNDPEMIAFYTAHNAFFSVGIFAPLAMGLLDSVNLDDGNSEVAGMFSGLLPVVNIIPAMRGGYWLIDQIKDWESLDTAERVGLVAAPVVGWTANTVSTAVASEMSDEVWGDYALNWGAYLLGALLGALISNTKVGRILDGINENFDPRATGGPNRWKISDLNLELGMPRAASGIPSFGPDMPGLQTGMPGIEPGPQGLGVGVGVSGRW